MSFSTILYEKAENVGFVRLNRPRVLNAYNIQMRDDLFEAFEAVRDDREVRVLVISGEGRAFSAGGDVTEFGTMPPPVLAREVRHQRDLWRVLSSLRCPTVAALHGFAFGSGLEMALFCDFRIASEDLRIALPESLLGMIPPAGGTQTSSRVARLGVALDLVLAARRLTAEEALRWGLVTLVVPGAELIPTTRRLAAKLVALDPIAVELTKRALRASGDLPLAEGLPIERHLALLAQERAIILRKGTI